MSELDPDLTGRLVSATAQGVRDFMHAKAQVPTNWENLHPMVKHRMLEQHLEALQPMLAVVEEALTTQGADLAALQLRIAMLVEELEHGDTAERNIAGRLKLTLED